MDKNYKIHITEEFDKEFEKLDNSLKLQISNEIDQLELNPYVGKPLGYKFFREKKVKGYRFYFLIYDQYVVVFIIALSDKKDQQEVIDKIKALIPIYREEIKNKLNL